MLTTPKNIANVDYTRKTFSMLTTPKKLLMLTTQEKDIINVDYIVKTLLLLTTLNKVYFRLHRNPKLGFGGKRGRMPQKRPKETNRSPATE